MPVAPDQKMACSTATTISLDPIEVPDFNHLKNLRDAHAMSSELVLVVFVDQQRNNLRNWHALFRLSL